jgi:hypothetical protein
MISRLKAACGVEYTSKLQRMFTDIDLSQELCTQFKEGTGSVRDRLSFDMHVSVLTSGAWPLSQNVNTEFILPKALENASSSFVDFYSGRHSGRKLFWLHHLSRVDVKLNGFDKRYEINMSTYQFSILLALNEFEQMSIKRLNELTCLPEQELIRLIKVSINSQLSLIITKVAFI